ncbi:MAG: hypothetical protein Q7S09_04455 [bacterium]|nr:hypothetical protein [bacterium]
MCRDAYADQTLHDSLFELRSQIQGYKTRIEESSQEVRSLQDAVLLIETRKKKLSLEKSLTQFSIADTGQRSADIDRKISEYMKRIARERGMLAELLRDIDTSQKRRVHLVLSASNFSSFFDTVHSTELVHRAVRESVGLIREEQRNLDRQKRSLQKQSHELILLHELELRQESALFQEDIRKKAIGAYTQKRGVLYQDLLRRAELASVSLQQEFFDREGVGRELSLAEAYAHAETLTRRVNIRPAFLLALVAQESRFGASQGSGNWKDDMEPSQWPGFLIIVQKLGLNPDTVPVSKKPSYGWGGAMGPAQFLPLTWLGYEDGIKELTGHALPSPWNIDDAFAGTALKLAQAGASEKTEATERKAALIYFAGENWDNPAFAFYADSILELAGDIEKELKLPPA